ncbi:saccharopine dehydrogenase family protein [Synergistes jonesii]|uniref:saccharopine dehydrogenase family protein n=1 Tax=Synergistes jonesii TaxID=2754 RepID=UPI00248E8E3E|nr:saccharopine dehydrogenase C-terminal domain-containing protein [Synergistes jonesii]
MAVKRKALQVGAGMIGRCIINDMISDFDFVVLDMSEENLAETKRLFPNVRTVAGSATDKELFGKLSSDCDIITAAMPGTVGYKVTQIAMELGKKLSSVSSMHGRADTQFHEIGLKTGGLGISMIGFEPGMSNFFSGRGYYKLDKCEEMYVYVGGGLPVNPRPPFNYFTTWSVSDNINQFNQPTTVVRGGKETIIPALSEVKHFEIDEFKNLECFTSNGLGSLFRSFRDVPEMAAYTVRWPGLAAQMRLLNELNLFDKEERMLGKVKQVPRDILIDIFSKKYERLPGDIDMSVMKIVVKGIKGNDRVSYTWEIVQKEIIETGYTSMAWTTASTCGIFARAMVDGRLSGKGMLSAEQLAKDDDFYNWVMTEQAKRGIRYKEKVEIEKNAKLWEK